MAYPLMRRTFFDLFSRRFDCHVSGWQHLPPSGAYIIAANHVSYLDPMILFSIFVRKTHRKIFFLTKDDVTRPLGARLSNYLGMIPVELHGDKSKALDPAIQKLQEGNVIGIFPEGRRNTEKELQKGKTGAVRLALASGVPIIPTGFFGPPGWTKRETAKNYMLRGNEVAVKFGPPCDFSQHRNETVTHDLLTTLTRELMLKISDLCGKPYPF